MEASAELAATEVLVAKTAAAVLLVVAHLCVAQTMVVCMEQTLAEQRLVPFGSPLRHTTAEQPTIRTALASMVRHTGRDGARLENSLSRPAGDEQGARRAPHA